jgi:tetratricopeptide (TPR) repeat protein
MQGRIVTLLGPAVPWLAVGLLALPLLLAPVGVRADGGGGGGGGGGGMIEPAKPPDPEYAAAVKAIEAGQYAKAVPLLERVVARDGANADAYNWMAYAIRRGGDPARAIPVYEKALAIDPKHRGAHEYIGEAYLALGNLAKAKEHLARLDRLCYFPCSQYRDLKRAVEAYERSGGQVKPGG